MSALPDLLGPVQVQLLDLLSLVLARRPHRDSLSQAQLHALSQALLLGAPLGSIAYHAHAHAMPDCKQQTSSSNVHWRLVCVVCFLPWHVPQLILPYAVV